MKSRNRQMRRKQLFTIFTIVTLVFSLIGGVFAETANDVAGHWAERSLTQWRSDGYLQGYPDGSVRPNQPVTRAEFIALVNRSFGFTEKAEVTFPDSNSNHWVYEELAKAVQADYISGYEDGTIRANNPVSRQEVAVMMTTLLDRLEWNEEVVVHFADAELLPSWSRGAIGAVVAHGIMSGYPDGSFQPVQAITRAEAVVTLERALAAIMQPEEELAFTYDQTGIYGPEVGTETIAGNVIVTVADVTLHNLIIEGDLTLAESIGDGDVTLDNVTVKGTTNVRGGGEESIHAINSVFVTIEVDKQDGSVRIAAEGTTTSAEVIVHSSVKLENNSTELTAAFPTVVLTEQLPEGSQVSLLGTYDQVDVLAGNILVEIPSGLVNELNISGADSTIALGEESTIIQLVLNTLTTLVGEGTVETAWLSEVARDSDFGEVNVKRIIGPGSEPSSIVSGGGGSSSSSGSSGGGGGSSTIPVTAVTITPADSAQLVVGDMLQLTATVKPDNATNKQVIWSSSAEAVATVDDDGLVTAHNEGTAIITVTTANGEKQDSITVTVYSETTVPTYRVTFDIEPPEAAATIEVRDSHNLTVTADVYGNYILPVGIYTYTVTADDYADATGSFIVHDVDQTIPVTLVAEGVESTTYSVTFTIEPSDVTATIVVRDDQNMVIIAEGDGSYQLESGTYTYSITAEGYQEETDTFAVDDTAVLMEINLIKEEIDVCKEMKPMDGNGSADNPYQITNLCQLQSMQDNLGAHYVLNNDIDASETRQWNGGAGFEPIGSSVDQRFRGTFNGNGKEISGLTINRPGTAYVGMFGHTLDALISNVRLVDIDVTGGAQTGGLVGNNEKTHITDAHVTGTIKGSANIGGLVGYNTSSRITDSSSQGTVTGTSISVGGLVGTNIWSQNRTRSFSIVNSHNEAMVSGGSQVGGLVGLNRGINAGIIDSTSQGTVSGHNDIGGLVGENWNSSVYDSSSISIVEGNNSVGGLVGYSQDSSSEIKNSHSTGQVSGVDEVGGLVGKTYFSAKIINSYSGSDVTGRANVGGLVGYHSAQSSYDQFSQIIGSYSTGNVHGTHAAVGGLVGRNWNSGIADSYSTSTVIGGSNNVGGLVGESSSGTHSIYDKAPITNSYSTGEVSGAGNNVGGLVGSAEYKTAITNSYSMSSVTGGNNVGGLVGQIGQYGNEIIIPEIVNSYSTGAVSGNNVGGLVGNVQNYRGSGSPTGKIEASYWDKETSGLEQSAVGIGGEGGEGKSTSEMKQKATFEGWNFADDFTGIWRIDEDNDYPDLQANPR